MFKLLWDYMNTRLEKKATATGDRNQSNAEDRPQSNAGTKDRNQTNARNQNDLKETYTMSEPRVHEVCIG